MIAILAELIVNFAVLFEFADDSEIPDDIAVKQLENIAFHLRRLDPEDRATFRAALTEIAEHEEAPERRAYLEQFPRYAGLEE